MSITFSDNKAIDANVVCDFFNQFATWKVHPLPKQWEKILSNSSAVISAWENACLLGLARGISDKVRYAQVL